MLGRLPRRCLATHRRRFTRRQGRTWGGGRPPTLVRHTHRAQLRAGALSPGGRGRGTTMPAASQRRLRAGQPRGCRDRHDRGDLVLGQPLCANCFDNLATVLWNAHAGALWNRTIIGLRRSLARPARVSVLDLGEVARVSFIEVVEYQARASCISMPWSASTVRMAVATSPQSGLDVAVLAASLRDAVAAASVPVLNPDGTQDRVMWGHSSTYAHWPRTTRRARWRSCGVHH